MAIELQDMLNDLRAQLQRTSANKPENGIHFRVGEVELELQVEVCESTGNETGGKFSFSVLSFGSVDGKVSAKSGKETSHCHTFRIKLEPIDTETGKSPEVSHRVSR